MVPPMKLTNGSPAGESNNCGCSQIIDCHGEFIDHSCQKFQMDVKLADNKLSYALVSIIGPQTSGKSTLLNAVFGTTFKQMNAQGGGRNKCTQGIWLQRAGITERCILVMDLEGTDGKEKQDNTTFEKQSAVFALLISDVVLINMWYNEVGRQQAGNRPLFETVFQAVVRSLSRRETTFRKTTLMFVVRDTPPDFKALHKPSMGGTMPLDEYLKVSDEGWKTKKEEDLKQMENDLKKDIREIWDSVSVSKSEDPFSNFYNIEVNFLPPPSPSEDGPFENKVAGLTQKFHQSIVPDVLDGDRGGVADGSSFSCNAQLLWKKIKEDKDLDLPDHKIMVATVRCEQIANEKFESFVTSEEWLKLCETVQKQTISDFGKKLSEMIKNCLLSYDEEATYLDRAVKLEKRKQLEAKLVQHVNPTYQDMLQRIKPECLKNFRESVEKALHEGGEKLIEVAPKCVDYTITQFKEKFRDARMDQANWDESVEMLREFKWDMAAHIYTVAKQMHGKDRKNFNITKESAAQAFTPKVSVPALCASIASQLVAGVGTIAPAVAVRAGTMAPVVAVGAITPAVLIGFGVGIAVADAVAAADEKRKMTEVTDYIVGLLHLPSSVCEENQLIPMLLTRSNFISGENQLDVEHLEGSSSVCGESSWM
ncbi:hypothetical protein ACSBR2_023466 [Camellia fascicularis]